MKKLILDKWNGLNKQAKIFVCIVGALIAYGIIKSLIG